MDATLRTPSTVGRLTRAATGRLSPAMRRTLLIEDTYGGSRPNAAMTAGIRNHRVAGQSSREMRS
jgi:hypothetical protein